MKVEMAGRRQVAEIRRQSSEARARALAAQQPPPAPARAPAGMTVEQFRHGKQVA